MEDNFLLWQRGGAFKSSDISPEFMLTQWESTMDLYAGELQRLGHECVKYVPSLEGGPVEYLKHSLGHTVARVPCAIGAYPLAMKLDWRLSAVSFSRRVRREDSLRGASLVHYQSLYSSFFLASTMLGKRRTVQYTGGALPKLGGVRRMMASYLLRMALKGIEMVLLDDKDPESLGQSALLERAGVRPERVRRLPTLIVDPLVFHERDKKVAKATLGIHTSAMVVLVVSAVMQEPRAGDLLTKDPFKALRVFARLVEGEAVNAELHVVGGGSGMASLKAAVWRLGLEDRVHLHGVVPHSQVALYISASDVVFVPYHFVDLNYGTAVLEAFASGRPACGFKRVREGSGEREGGFLLDLDEAIAAKELGERLRDPGYLERKAAEGGRVAEDHLPASVAKGLESAFAVVAGAR